MTSLANSSPPSFFCKCFVFCLIYVLYVHFWGCGCECRTKVFPGNHCVERIHSCIIGWDCERANHLSKPMLRLHQNIDFEIHRSSNWSYPFWFWIHELLNFIIWFSFRLVCRAVCLNFCLSIFRFSISTWSFLKKEINLMKFSFYLVVWLS